MQSSTIALLSILGASFFFALPPIVTKLLYHSFEPIPLAFLRFLIASIFMFPIFLAQKNRDPLFKSVKVIAPYTIFSTINILFFYLGIAKTTADSSAIIYSDVPLVTAIISYFLIHERLSQKKKIGILLGLFGVALIAILPLFQKGIKTGDFTGNILILVATLSWATYGITSKKIIQKGFSPITISMVSFLVSTIAFFITSIFISRKDFITPIFDGNNLILLLLLGGIITVGSYVLMQWALKHTSATIVSLNQYIQPIFTISLATVILGEKLTLEFIFGALLVLLGVFIATNSDKFLFKKRIAEQVALAGEE